MSETLILHEYTPSGNCHKVRLTASHLGLPIERREYDIMRGETRTPEFLANINPNGRIPVLQVGERMIPESNAACIFLAEGTRLVPEDRFERANMLRWMFFEQNHHEPNVATMRLWVAYIRQERLTEAQRNQLEPKLEAGAAALKVMDEHLAARPFFVGEGLTLADIALYPYTYTAEEGGFRLADYPNVQAWMARVANEPGHVSMFG